ncbi:MAG TPA: thiamine pyrophosphate-dependent enzyme, partial [Planctomycetota bacterium]|nr:thiamine pyrophosphate-dependent enzyme [Planctomycetota bacterium]
MLRSLAAAPKASEAAMPRAVLTGQEALELFESQVVARHLDLEARAMKRRDEGYYTIGSAGHEGNVVLGRLVRTSDPSFLHYRSAALMVERARQVPASTPIMDTLLGVVASKDDPISGGRHKVFGSRALGVPPQTSTIASHLPKAVGCAFSLERAKALRLPVQVPADAMVLCTFGDASVNHASAQTSFNAASWTAFQKLPLPILFVCEDNHIGISVRTPTNWIATRCSSLPHIKYFHANGLSLPEAYETAKSAVEYVRSRRRPAFLHMEVVRLLGHAGSDVESEYLLREEIEANEARDPLLQTARYLVESGTATGEDLLGLYQRTKEQVAAVGREAVRRRKLVSSAEVLEHLVKDQPEAVRELAERVGDHGARCTLFGGEDELPERQERPRHLAVQMNRALMDALASYPEALIFGEDVGRKGGVYHVTTDLTRRAGASRVFNTLLDETIILGIAQGAAHLGLLPIPEIQYLAYYHNAEDQLRSEACSLQFFSAGQFQNPLVLRIASFGYQKGFGGHFHNDSSTAVLRDLPGITIAVPARPDDAVLMFRTCLSKAKVDGAVVVFLEPIALYM